MARYMLTTRAQIAGAIREPGFVFELKDGELGPHRTEVADSSGASITGANQKLRDVPLYIPYKEPEEKPTEAPSAADLDTKAT